MILEVDGVVLRTEAVLGVAVEQTLDKLLAVVANGASRELDLAKANIAVHLLRVLGVEWTPAAAHFKQQDTK